MGKNDVQKAMSGIAYSLMVAQVIKENAEAHLAVISWLFMQPQVIPVSRVVPTVGSFLVASMNGAAVEVRDSETRQLIDIIAVGEQRRINPGSYDDVMMAVFASESEAEAWFHSEDVKRFLKRELCDAERDTVPAADWPEDEDNRDTWF